MTIGMLIESLAGKAGSLTGQIVDATPFQSSDAAAGSADGSADGGVGVHTNPTEEFGRELEAAGFASDGSEMMINGISGEPFPVDIYIGVVYYQRLRHMVSDKFQVCCRVWVVSGFLV
jgi:DNA-directed RNA polymerase I subunit RPA2